MIRLAEIIAESTVDGVGLRLVVFLQGCSNNCEGCHNPDLKVLDGGREMTEKELADLVIAKATPMHRGITFSGGEPLLQGDSLAQTIAFIKDSLPDLDFWLYTGYLFEDFLDHPVMALIDVVVDGPFIQSQRDASCVFYGSSNQRVINVQESRRLGKVVLWKSETAFK